MTETNDNSLLEEARRELPAVKWGARADAWSLKGESIARGPGHIEWHVITDPDEPGALLTASWAGDEHITGTGATLADAVQQLRAKAQTLANVGRDAPTSFRTPCEPGQSAVEDTASLSPESAGFFMSPEAAVRTHGMQLVAALERDGLDPKAMFEQLAAHMAVPTGLPMVDGVGQPARVEVKGHERIDGLVRQVGRRKGDGDSISPGGVIVEYFDARAGRPVVRWFSEFALFSIAPTCEGELLDRLFDHALEGCWARHSPGLILQRWQANATQLDPSVPLDAAVTEFAAAVKACPLPGAWGKGLAPAVILLHLRRLLDPTDAAAQLHMGPLAMPRWFPQSLIDAAEAWSAAAQATKGTDDDPIEF